ncbi:hypothetical protein GCM10023320_24000 [Pseudonocardia adelaidensis]|uniref:Extradiol ring-cleavage dioxygenase LigAB LigA subunit domain-containing protein n=2 Tax=Pseudonocardia adelaidensis TaxID=648754 RepID=A0ABP9NM26_9PSEU
MDATGSEPSRGFTELIGRALTDEQFRDSMFRDRAAVVEPFALTPTDLEALDSLSRETLDEHARQFAEGNATALTISIVIRIRF